MWFSSFGVSVVINDEEKMGSSESCQRSRGRVGFLVVVQHTHSHTDVSYSPSSVKATLDLFRIQHYNEKYGPKRVQPNEEQTEHRNTLR